MRYFSIAKPDNLEVSLTGFCSIWGGRSGDTGSLISCRMGAVTGAVTTGAPHSEQNFILSLMSFVPHSEQNFGIGVNIAYPKKNVFITDGEALQAVDTLEPWSRFRFCAAA
jgi:hypothetical protein